MKREPVKRKCKKFILNDEALSKKFKACSEEDQEWVLQYLSAGIEVIPYEMITRFDSLHIFPEQGSFYLPH